MSNDFRLGTLEQIIDFRNGKAIKKTDGDIPIYGGNGVLGYSDKSNYERTLVIGRVGAYCGSVHIEKGKCWVSDNAIAGLPKNGYNNEYNYYLLKSLRLNEQRIGSSQPLLTQGILNNIQVKIQFHPSQQKKIAVVLSALDAKIDCNNRINAELEAMAKALYDYWFVQFDFPDAHGKPYQSSGGKMVYNATLKREIPEGWEAVELGNIVEEIRDGITPAAVSAQTPYIGLEHISRKSMILDVWANAEQATSNKNAFRSGDIIFGKIRPYFHKVGFAMMDGITSTDSIVIRAKNKMLSGIAFETIFSNEFVDAATASSTGSKMPRADWAVLKRYGVVLPERNAPFLQRYQQMFETITQSIDKNVRENQHLTQLRDWLLPLLMNGQVTVA